MFTVMGTQEPEGQCRQLMPSEANNAVHSTWNVLVQTVLVENGRYSADASRALASNLAVGVERAGLVAGGRPGCTSVDLRKSRNVGLFRSASWPAAISISTCSGGNLNRVSTALSAAARSGPSWSNVIRLTKNSRSRQFQSGGAPKR